MSICPARNKRFFLTDPTETQEWIESAGLAKGDVLRFTVQSCSSITRASLALEVTKA